MQLIIHQGKNGNQTELLNNLYYILIDCVCTYVDTHMHVHSMNGHIVLYRSSSALKASHLQSTHQLLKVEPLQVQGTKQTIVELPMQQPKKEMVPQLANSTSSNFPAASKYHKKHVPKYTTPFPSPTTSQPTSPVIRNDKKPANASLLSSSTSKQVKGQIYDLNKMAGAIASSAESSDRVFKQRNEGWWSCLSLPSNNHSALVGTYTTGTISVAPGDASVAAAHEVPNLTLLTPAASTNNINVTLSPRIASPTNVSPLSASKSRTARWE